MRRHDAPGLLPVEAGRVRRRQVLRHEDARGREHGPRHRPSQDVREHLGADAAQVRGPSAQVLVLERVPRGGGPLDGVLPGACRAAVIVVDGPLRRFQERLVSKEQQVRVEDLSLRLTGAAPIARSSAFTSTSGSPASSSGISISGTWKRRAGPIATPGEAG